MARELKNEKTHEPAVLLNDNAPGSLMGQLKSKLERLKRSPLRKQEAKVLHEIGELESKLAAAREFEQERNAEVEALGRYYSAKHPNDVPVLAQIREAIRQDISLDEVYAQIDKAELLKYLAMQVWGKDRYIVCDGLRQRAMGNRTALEASLRAAQERLAEVQRQM